MYFNYIRNYGKVRVSSLDAFLASGDKGRCETPLISLLSNSYNRLLINIAYIYLSVDIARKRTFVYICAQNIDKT